MRAEATARTQESVEQLVLHGVAIPPATQIAAVGPATARAVRHAGYEAAFVPQGESSAAALALQGLADLLETLRSAHQGPDDLAAGRGTAGKDVVENPLEHYLVGWSFDQNNLVRKDDAQRVVSGKLLEVVDRLRIERRELGGDIIAHQKKGIQSQAIEYE